MLTSVVFLASNHSFFLLTMIEFAINKLVFIKDISKVRSLQGYTSGRIEVRTIQPCHQGVLHKPSHSTIENNGELTQGLHEKIDFGAKLFGG